MILYKVELENGCGDYATAYVLADSEAEAVELARDLDIASHAQDLRQVTALVLPTSGVLFATQTRHEEGEFDMLVIEPESP